LPAGLRAERQHLAGTDAILTSADGTGFRARLAHAAGEGGSGMIIAPDVRGLHPFYASLAERFADAGVHAIAFDYFGRTLGTAVPPPSFYEGSFQTAPFREHVTATKPSTIQEDIRAASAYLRQHTPARRLFVVGFCFGGRVALNASAEQSDLTGVIAFYGPPVQREANDVDAPMLKVDRMRAPVLGLYGGADQGIPQLALDTFARALAGRQLAHEIVTYPGAPHSFFDRTFDQHHAACDDAWKRMLAFVRTADPSARL
jgi:carboxymethylenebutenolidase